MILDFLRLRDDALKPLHKILDREPATELLEFRVRLRPRQLSDHATGQLSVQHARHLFDAPSCLQILLARIEQRTRAIRTA